MARTVNVDQAERLRGSYRYLFLLSSVLIHCCDRNACASTLCAAHSFERNACYNVHICRREGRWREGSNIVVIERGQHTRHSRTRGWPRPSVCVIAIGARFYCPVHSFIVVIEMRALSPAHSLLLWSNCVLQRASKLPLCAMAWWWHQKCFDWGRPVKCEKSTQAMPQEVGFPSGRASAWVLSVPGAVGATTARDQKLKIWRESRLGVWGMRTDVQTDISAFTKIDTQFCKLRILVASKCLVFYPGRYYTSNFYDFDYYFFSTTVVCSR